MRCIRANSANKITADSTSSLVSVHTLWLCLVFSAVAISLCASFSMEPTYPLAPIANLIACALVVIPLFRMANAPWNTGVYAFALYLVLQSLSTGVNTIVWSRDAVNRAPVWCDICTMFSIAAGGLSITENLTEASHLQVLVSTGIPACSFVITRRLYKITRLQDAIVSKGQGSNFFHLPIQSELIGIYRGASCYYLN